MAYPVRKVKNTHSLIQLHGQLDPTDISNALSSNSAGFGCNVLYVSLDVHPPALECGVHSEMHHVGVDPAVVVVNEHRVSGDLPACRKPAHGGGGGGQPCKQPSKRMFKKVCVWGGASLYRYLFL